MAIRAGAEMRIIIPWTSPGAHLLAVPNYLSFKILATRGGSRARLTGCGRCTERHLRRARRPLLEVGVRREVAARPTLRDPRKRDRGLRGSEMLALLSLPSRQSALCAAVELDPRQ